MTDEQREQAGDKIYEDARALCYGLAGRELDPAAVLTVRERAIVDAIAEWMGSRDCEIAKLKADNARLDALLNTPELLDFSKAVVLEAAHQLERWDPNHDASKTDADWFWLIGYLAGKALHTPIGKDWAGIEPKEILEKRLHRIVTIAAAAANWHAHTLRELNAETSAQNQSEASLT